LDLIEWDKASRVLDGQFNTTVELEKSHVLVKCELVKNEVELDLEEDEDDDWWNQ
jgi:hypothetical protein